jgi:hypothetical protein
MAARPLVAPGQTLQLAYPDEPGVGSGPGHFNADYLRAAELIVADSGLAVRWQALPIARGFRAVRNGQANFCVGGAIITEERAAFGQFSHPFRVDHLLAVVGLKSQAAALAQAHSFDELVGLGPATFVGIKDLVYGHDADRRLAQLGSRLSFAAHSTAQVFDMVGHGRATYGLLPRNFGGATMATRPDRDGFVMVSFPDLRRDAAMGFFCSKAVAPAVLQQLNAAITRQLPRLRSLFPDQAVAAQP